MFCLFVRNSSRLEIPSPFRCLGEIGPDTFSVQISGRVMPLDEAASDITSAIIYPKKTFSTGSERFQIPVLAKSAEKLIDIVGSVSLRSSTHSLQSRCDWLLIIVVPIVIFARPLG